MDLIKLSELLTKRKKELRLTDKEISGNAMVSCPYWIALRNGNNPKTNKPSRPSYDVLFRIAQELQLDLNMVMELAGYQPFNNVSSIPPSEAMGRNEIKGKETFICDESPIPGSNQTDTVEQHAKLKKQLTKVLRDLGPLKTRILTSNLEWLQTTSPEIFELPEIRTERQVSKELIEKVHKRDNYRCLKCGASNTDLSFSHIIPLSKGGKSDSDNLITLCKHCISRAITRVD